MKQTQEGCQTVESVDHQQFYGASFSNGIVKEEISMLMFLNSINYKKVLKFAALPLIQRPIKHTVYAKST